MTRNLTDRRIPIEIWTDGSVQPMNPGPHGGWAAVLYLPQYGKYRAMSGYFRDATNQRAEGYAVLHALDALTKPCNVKIHTDSMYVIRCIQRMKTKHKLPDANQDIWRHVLPLLKTHSVTAFYVKGHNHNKLNDWADFLAYKAAQYFQGEDHYHASIPLIEVCR